MPDIAYPEPDYGFPTGLMTDEELAQVQQEQTPSPIIPDSFAVPEFTSSTGNVGEQFVAPPVPSSRMVPPDVTIEPIAPEGGTIPAIPKYGWEKDIRPIPEGMDSGGYDEYNLPINQTARNAAFGFGPPPVIRAPQQLTPEQYRAKAYSDLQEAERKEVNRATLFHEDVGLARANAERNLNNFRASTLIREQIAKGMSPQDAVALAAATYGGATGGSPPDWMLKFGGTRKTAMPQEISASGGQKFFRDPVTGRMTHIPEVKTEKSVQPKLQVLDDPVTGKKQTFLWTGVSWRPLQGTKEMTDQQRAHWMNEYNSGMKSTIEGESPEIKAMGQLKADAALNALGWNANFENETVKGEEHKYNPFLKKEPDTTNKVFKGFTPSSRTITPETPQVQGNPDERGEPIPKEESEPPPPKEKRVVGKIYKTPKGNAEWTGHNWILK